MRRKQLHDNSHLTLEQRKIIQTGIENNSTKSSIAKTIGKDETTVAKEIRNHRTFKPRNTFNSPILCMKRKSCNIKVCLQTCSYLEKPTCFRRDKSPGACNKCENLSKCRLDKYFYTAIKADEEYHNTLVNSREGINLTKEERINIADIIAPLLKQGQSIHQILSSHKEIIQSERTLYHYIECGVFKDFGVDCFSLKEQINRKQFKQKYKKRRERVDFKGRKYEDFLEFHLKNPDTPITEMDTLYNSPQGPFLQTFMFEKASFMVGFLHDEKTNESMSGSLDLLQDKLGIQLFSKLFSLLLTDRGPEFEKHQMFELHKSGSTRLSIFYCDPMQSYQKPHVENNHNYVRDIIPNRYPMDTLSQEDINLMFSHINGTPRRSLGDKTPYELFCFLYGKEAAELLGIKEIQRDDVILKPSLIYSKNVCRKK